MRGFLGRLSCSCPIDTEMSMITGFFLYRALLPRILSSYSLCPLNKSQDRALPRSESRAVALRTVSSRASTGISNPPTFAKLS